MAIILESDYKSFTCKLHCKSFIKLTPGFHLRSNMFFIQEQTLQCKYVLLVNVVLHNLSLVNFEKSCHCIILLLFLLRRHAGFVLHHWFQTPQNRKKHLAYVLVLSSFSQCLEPVMKHLFSFRTSCITSLIVK